MKFLLASDVHDNLSGVQAMRAQEQNDIDAIVLAGDLDTRRPKAFFDILETFGCPVLYVWGNHDEYPYDAFYGPNCHHLHLKVRRVGPITFAGWSGHPTDWRNNPISKPVYDAFAERHGAFMETRRQVGAEYQAAVAEIEAEYAAAVSELADQARQRGKFPSEAKLHALKERRKKRIVSAGQAVDKFRRSAAHRSFLSLLSTLNQELQQKNIGCLYDLIQASGADLANTVVVTHDRLTHVTRDLPGICTFLHGHLHGFSDTSTPRTGRHINVSALCGIGDTANYVVMKWSPQSGFSVQSVECKTGVEGVI